MQAEKQKTTLQVGNKQKQKNKREWNLVPKSTLGEWVSLPLEITHYIAPVIGAGLDVLKKADEDILMDVGVPNHHLTFGHDVGWVDR